MLPWRRGQIQFPLGEGGRGIDSLPYTELWCRLPACHPSGLIEGTNDLRSGAIFNRTRNRIPISLHYLIYMHPKVLKIINKLAVADSYLPGLPNDLC